MWEVACVMFFILTEYSIILGSTSDYNYKSEYETGGFDRHDVKSGTSDSSRDVYSHIKVWKDETCP